MAALNIPGNIVAIFDGMSNAARCYYLRKLDERAALNEIAHRWAHRTPVTGGVKYGSEFIFPNHKKFGSHAGKLIHLVEPDSPFADLLYEWRKLSEDSVALKLKLIVT
jgi:hypothetical protein